ncbi:MAG TPA: LppX_LprAFG lipoprotein [Nocardioidaceae bacterium]|nr:LppX_LprAFG lipoprotein [Nocardioidaceae bacterium]
MRARLAIATAAAVCTGSLAACSEAPVPGGSAASGTAASSPSASGSAVGRLDKTSLVPALTASQKKAGSAHVSITMSGAMSLSGEGDVSYREGDPQMQMTMKVAQLGAGRISLRYVDGIVYLGIPRLTPPGTFLRVDPDDAGSPLGRSLGRLSEQLDPMRSMAGLQAAVREVRYAGPATVDGVATDHYVMTVDTDAALEAMKHKAPAGMPARLRYHLWLDDRDLLRRMRFDVAGQKTVVDMSRWGEQVRVQAPPPGKIAKSPARFAAASAG